jgi:hypothetical protein
MSHTRPLLLAVSTLALLVSACSQPADVQVPRVMPQFGTAADDSATSVATHSAHPHVFVAGTTGTAGDKAFIRRYNRDGSLAWERLSASRGTRTEVGGVGTDVAGNAYIAYADLTVVLSKLNKNGGLLWRKQLSEANTSYQRTSLDALTTDSAGNSYVALGSAVSTIRPASCSGSASSATTKPASPTLQSPPTACSTAFRIETNKKPC